jgi:hypothetical protein
MGRIARPRDRRVPCHELREVGTNICSWTEACRKQRAMSTGVRPEANQGIWNAVKDLDRRRCNEANGLPPNCAS